MRQSALSYRKPNRASRAACSSATDLRGPGHRRAQGVGRGPGTRKSGCAPRPARWSPSAGPTGAARPSPTCSPWSRRGSRSVTAPPVIPSRVARDPRFRGQREYAGLARLNVVQPQGLRARTVAPGRRDLPSARRGRGTKKAPFPRVRLAVAEGAPVERNDPRAVAVADGEHVSAARIERKPYTAPSSGRSSVFGSRGPVPDRGQSRSLKSAQLVASHRPSGLKATGLKSGAYPSTTLG